MTTTKHLERIFQMKLDQETIKLPDPGLHMTPSQVLDFYSLTYPELTTATVQAPVIIEDKQHFEFDTVIGIKG